ncbi:MAG TPA: DNA mismatch repair endonuclease MutL [Nitrospiraceae bacterium]|nr:DNA mismatch repair endonuclease MutL [Nitrospiraceae bacterium]
MPAASCSAKIHVLPDDVVSRIAAGEVVERPAAVVKELLENSLDAGGLRITVDVKDGGLALIRVTDDGEGIGRADLPRAFERHATSKLRSDRDLVSVTTMGFRGEALPSIASVSHVLVTTATRQDRVGSQFTLVAGAGGAIIDAPPMPGTRIEVSNLFFNQPARKKFLKSATTEFSHISHVVQLAGLAWPSVHFRLTHNGLEILNYPAVTADRDRILQVYRQGFLDRTIEVRGRAAGLSIRGAMVDPVLARSSRTPQELFVNRRPIRNATVFHAVMEGYGSFLPKGSHPTFVLFLDIEPSRLDVNVHPTKKEVRFAETEALHQLVRQSVRYALSGSERKVVLGLSQAGVSQTAQEFAPTAERQTESFLDSRPASSISVRRQDSRIDRSEAAPLSGIVEGSQLAFAHEAGVGYQRAEKSDIVPFGQILRTYLVAQVGEELQVIDQHTAHERVLFQRLWRGWQSRDIPSQPLLIPEPIELSVAQSALLLTHADDLEKLGLLIEPFGASAVAIRGVPVGLGKVDAAVLVQDLLDDLTEWDSASSLEVRAQPVLASLACHGAVRAGRALALPEIQQLIHDWVQEGLIMTCPHGRRTAFRLSTDELAKLFGRVGWV